MGSLGTQICNHRILGRVRILRVLNPAAWEDGFRCPSLGLQSAFSDFEVSGFRVGRLDSWASGFDGESVGAWAVRSRGLGVS